MKDLIGKKVKGFKFEDTGRNDYVELMDEQIGEVGVITDHDSSNNVWLVEFEFGREWQYPADQIEAHLVDEWVVGEEYEFRDYIGDTWSKRKLLAVLPSNYDSRFIVEFLEDADKWNSFHHIRHIEDPVQKQIEKLEKELAELKQLTSK
jgi:hypothetical protein